MAEQTWTRHYLSEEEKLMTNKQLMDLLKCSRPSAWRAKKQGFFCIGYPSSKKAKSVQTEAEKALPKLSKLPARGELVVLNQLEQKLSKSALARRYRIGTDLAGVALQEGSFRIPMKGGRRRDKIEGPKNWKPPKKCNYDPSSRYFRVNLATEELSYTEGKLMDLYSFWGLSWRQAKEAKACGYFCPNVAVPFEPKVDEGAFRAIADRLLPEIKRGVSQALKRYFGSGWNVKIKGYNQDDLESAAIAHLHDRSGFPEFAEEKWRVSVAKFGVLGFLSTEARRRKKEGTTVDEMEGRFEDD